MRRRSFLKDASVAAAGVAVGRSFRLTPQVAEDGSRRDNTVFLHVANTQRTKPVAAALQVAGHTIRGGRVFEIAEDSTVELSYLNSGDAMKTVEKPLRAGAVWHFRRRRSLLSNWSSRNEHR